jgi:hypothetical protein
MIERNGKGEDAQSNGDALRRGQESPRQNS